jgi:hypothetical protein
VHLQVYSFLQEVKEIRPNAATANTNFFMFYFVLKLKAMWSKIVGFWC